MEQIFCMSLDSFYCCREPSVYWHIFVHTFDCAGMSFDLFNWYLLLYFQFWLCDSYHCISILMVDFVKGGEFHCL